MTTDANATINIAWPGSDRDRHELRDFLASHISNIAETAIPNFRDDHYYNPIILQAKTGGGDTVGGALTCRPPVAVAAYTGALNRMPTLGYERVLDKVSMLDLMAVDPFYRRHGIGRRLINEMEAALAQRRTRIWFGSITDEESLDQATAFYSGCGFTVLLPGHPLPPFLGKEWTIPGQHMPLVWFYKQVAGPA